MSFIFNTTAGISHTVKLTADNNTALIPAGVYLHAVVVYADKTQTIDVSEGTPELKDIEEGFEIPEGIDSTIEINTRYRTATPLYFENIETEIKVTFYFLN